MADWKPIKTAPKDGTNILIAKFDEPMVIQNDYWTEYNEPEDGKIYGCWCDWPPGYLLQPTHWKPIDPPN